MIVIYGFVVIIIISIVDMTTDQWSSRERERERECVYVLCTPSISRFTYITVSYIDKRRVDGRLYVERVI